MVRALFDEFPAHKLAGFIIWVPMLPDDNAQTARFEQERMTDPRLHFWFDEDKATANSWSSFVGYPGTTWDVYAFYDDMAAWTGDAPPLPRIWMHQLNETPATRAGDTLDAGRLAREWLVIIGASASSAEDLARRLHERGTRVSERADPFP